MNLDPRTDILIPRGAKRLTITDYAPYNSNDGGRLFSEFCTKARAALGIAGEASFTRAYNGRAYLQIWGDTTQYSVRIPREYASLFVTFDCKAKCDVATASICA
jgi:hypothetical protein